MAAVTIRKLPEKTHRALKLRAAAMAAAPKRRFAGYWKTPSQPIRRQDSDRN